MPTVTTDLIVVDVRTAVLIRIEEVSSSHRKLASSSRWATR